MTSVLGILDDAPPLEDRELRRLWDDDVRRSLSTHASDWVEAVQVSGAPDGGLDRDRGWWLLASGRGRGLARRLAALRGAHRDLRVRYVAAGGEPPWTGGTSWSSPPSCAVPRWSWA